jgi:hypothetical protein
MALYVPGTEETDPKKIIMSQQLVAGQTTTNTTAIATNTTNIATNTTNIATNTTNIATNTANIATIQGDYASKTSNNTLAGVQTFSNATEATGAGTTAAALFAGGVEIAKKLFLSGLLTITNGQIKFPASANPSADANTLDDYEEGTFTPAFSATGCSFSYNTQVGNYTKVGNVVHFSIFLKLNTSGNTLNGNTVSVTGLPFTSSSSFRGSYSVRWNNGTTNYVIVLAFIDTSTTTVTFGQNAGAFNSVGNPTPANGLLHATNASDITICGTYFV